MRRSLILFAFIFIGLLILSGTRDNFARLFWSKYRSAGMALALTKTDADLAMFIGNYYFNGVIGSREYNTDIAKRAYEKAVLINQKILWGHYQLSRIYFVKGDFNKALDEINKELAANPENLRSLYVRGLIFGYRGNPGDLEKAEQDFRRFAKWAPKEWAGYNDLAWILAKQGKYREAEKIIGSAFSEVKDAEKNPWLWNGLGVAQLNIREYFAAVNSFTKALALAKNLTAADWRHAYPGNNPSTSSEGLSAFVAAIEENLRRAEIGLVDK